jgi:hypothetical protein
MPGAVHHDPYKRVALALERLADALEDERAARVEERARIAASEARSSTALSALLFGKWNIDGGTQSAGPIVREGCVRSA